MMDRIGMDRHGYRDAMIDALHDGGGGQPTAPARPEPAVSEWRIVVSPFDNDAASDDSCGCGCGGP